MMPRITSATRFNVVSRSREVLTASATSSSNDSTLVGTALVCAVSTEPMIPARCRQEGCSGGACRAGESVGCLFGAQFTHNLYAGTGADTIGACRHHGG